MLRRSLIPVLTMLLVCSFLPSSARATYTNNPPAQPGFTHSPKLSGDDTGQGLRLDGAAIGRGSPTIADIDGNAANGKEIAVGGTDGMLYVYHQNGSLAWKVQVAPACSAAQFPDGMINDAPAVGALYGDGVSYVVIGYGTNNYYPNCAQGGVAAYDGRTGALKWRYALANPNETLHGVYSSPGLADVNGDGKLEVGFGTLERDIYILSADGVKLWRFHNADTVVSSPAFADVDGDGKPDMVIGSDISANSNINPPTQNGGYVTAFRGTDGTVLWRRFFNQVIYSSPAIVDLEGNGTQEVVIGSGCYFDRSQGDWIKILNLRDGSDVRTLNADGCINSSPAIADLDGNGKLDIVAMVDGTVSGQGTVEAWQYDNPTPKWKTAPGTPVEGANDSGLFNDLRSATIADIDGNGSLEVLAVNYGDVAVLDGATGRQLTCNKCTNSTQSLYAWSPLKVTPAVGDLDGNGVSEVVVGGSNPNDSSHGYLYAWTNIAIGSPQGSAAHYSAPWPMFRGGPIHAGVAPKVQPTTSTLGVLVQPGADPQEFTIGISDPSGDSDAWTAKSNQPWLTIRPSSGITPTSVQIVVAPSVIAAQGTGVFAGAITISSSFGTSTINVKLVVTDTIYNAYIPMTIR